MINRRASWSTSLLILASAASAQVRSSPLESPRPEIRQDAPRPLVQAPEPSVVGPAGSAPAMPPLRPRWTAPKPDRIRLAGHNVKGMVLIKFVEGSDVRLENGRFRADARPRGAGSAQPVAIQPVVPVGGGGPLPIVPSADAELVEISGLIAEYRSRFGFEASYAFDPRLPGQGLERQRVEKEELERKTGEQLADLHLYYVLYSPTLTDAAVQERLMNELNRFRLVEQVSAAVLAGVPQASADASGRQTYLDPAPRGIGAEAAWARRGGRGDGVIVADVEYDWVEDHEDFIPTSARHAGGRPPMLPCPYVAEGSEHGTAALGIIAAPHNGFGVKGIAPNIRYQLSSVCGLRDLRWPAAVATFDQHNRAGRFHNVVVATTLLEAGRTLRAGDVLLIEQHSPGPVTGAVCTASNCKQFEYVPMEFYQESFDVIRRLTAREIIVVEPAGNGRVDLDHPVYEGRFSPAVRHSRALLVASARSRASGNVPSASTNTGRRIDLHSWGSGIATTGYGDNRDQGPPFDNGDIPRFYTTSFGGTSGASAIVAGAVASLQGIRRATGKRPLTVAQMRETLFATGTRQRNTTLPGGFIGRQPNLRMAGPLAAALDVSVTPGKYRIRARSSGKSLDLDDSWFGGGNDGQPLQQWDWFGKTNQQFWVTGTAPGKFTIQPLNSMKCLGVANASQERSAPIQQAACSGGDSQNFRFEAVGSDFKIVAVHSNQALHVTGDNVQANGARVVQFRKKDSKRQRFELVPLD